MHEKELPWGSSFGFGKGENGKDTEKGRLAERFMNS
jgi:hypothetical protein